MGLRAAHLLTWGLGGEPSLLLRLGAVYFPLCYLSPLLLGTLLPFIVCAVSHCAQQQQQQGHRGGDPRSGGQLMV